MELKKFLHASKWKMFVMLLKNFEMYYLSTLDGLSIIDCCSQHVMLQHRTDETHVKFLLAFNRKVHCPSDDLHVQYFTAKTALRYSQNHKMARLSL